MQELSFGRPNFAQTAVVTLLQLVGAAMLALVLAYWTWILFAPGPTPRVEIRAEPAGHLAAAGALFAQMQKNTVIDAPTAAAIALVGVVAASGDGPGYAVVRLDTKLLTVRAGDDIAPGFRLERVFPDHVTLERNGARETLAWPVRGKPAAPIVPGTGK